MFSSSIKVCWKANAMNTTIRLKSQQMEHPHASCALCVDEGLPARILSLDETGAMASVRTQDGVREVALDLIDEARVGDYILVHLDTAIARLNAEDVVD